MSACETSTTSSSQGHIPGRQYTDSRLNFSLLTPTEKETFRAGLRTRIFCRIHDAVTAPTASLYNDKRAENIGAYATFVEAHRIETQFGGQPASEELVRALFADVERELGEAHRHQLEHALNIARTAQQIMARVAAREPSSARAEPAAYLIFQWIGGWVLLNWATDCVVFLTHESGVPAVDVLEAVFSDLRSAAETIYIAASQFHDTCVGDPDEVEE